MAATKKRKATIQRKRRGPPDGTINADGTAYNGRTAPIFTAMAAAWLLLFIALCAILFG